MPDLANEMREQGRIDYARAHNKRVALDLAAAGIPVFVANPENKASLVKAFTRLDADIPKDEAESLRREFYDKHGFAPLHIGATTEKSAIRRMFREKPDALPAISCGPAGLLVVDNDVKERNGAERNGVELFDAFCEANGGLPDGVIAVQSQGRGRHLYFSNEGNLGCSAGSLKAACESDVKAAGGFVIAPSAIRIHDGRRYGERSSLDALIKARKGGTLVPIPEFIRQAIGSRAESSSVTEKSIQALVDELRQTELPDGAALLDPALDGVEWQTLVDRYDSLRKAIDEGDRSNVRFNLARALKAERPETTPADFAAILIERPDECGVFVEDEKPAQGEFGWRNIVKDFERAKAVPGSNGEQFDAVDDDEDGEPASEQGKAKVDKFAEIDAGFAWSVDMHASFTPAEDLIEDLLPAVGVVVLRGDSNTGKTFATTEMLDCVLRGAKFLGRNVVQGGAMLIAGEGQEGLKKRMAALHTVRPYGGAGIAVRFDLPNFETAQKAAAKKLSKTIERYKEIQGHDLKLLVLDNLIRMINGGDLHLSAAVTPMLRALSDLAYEHRLCIVIIHHENKSGGIAGTFAIRANADVVLQLSEKNGVRTIAIDKSRDGDKSAKLHFSLRFVPLGKNMWGNEVGSCVVEPYSKASDNLAVDDDEELPTLKTSDRREDRIAAILDVFEGEAKRQKADDENVSSIRRQLELQSGEIVDAVNARRKSDGLEMLSRSTIRDHIGVAVQAGSLEPCGTKGKPLYRLA
ncbi:AAA family ATPase [Bradyrhizobium sp. Ghvi]|uniref:AAA family ATPase n=1 Tax=Bradyrhizobium sp. Ghvi TaxID=1855319 RepID=UPI0015A63727|nr:AAA family ATPase [Bradyrhizobium sp. Ghvi]